MAEYKYETHLHTCQGSACGHLTGEEQADLYKGFGSTGIVVTDHFFNGNCAIPRDLPWKERVEQFCAGYRSAKKRGDDDLPALKHRLKTSVILLIFLGIMIALLFAFFACAISHM